jgi:hypothetical protein
MTKTSIEQRLAIANIALSNALGDRSLAAALAAYGYTAERLRQGVALHENALALYQRQKVEYGDLRTTNDAYTAALAQAQETYIRYVKVARIALDGEHGALQKLSLTGVRKRPHAGRLAQTQQFYANALSDPVILGRLAVFGITQAVLEAGQHQVEAVVAGNAARRRHQGAARDATRARGVAMAALDAWMRDFIQIARVALRDRPQFLGKLGVATARASAGSRGATTGSGGATLLQTVSPLPGSRPLPVDRPAGRRNRTKQATATE